MKRFCIVSAALLALAGCASSSGPAPVFDRSPAAATAPAPRSVVATPASTTTVTAPTTAATAPAPVPTAAPLPAPVATTAPPAAVEPGPVVKAGPKPEPVVAQSIDEPQARPYKDGDWRPEYHVVKKGDTLYSIALDYGQDYKDVAAWNSLEDPGVIKIDQKLRLFPPEGSAETPAGAVAAAAEAPHPVAQVPAKSEPKARKLPYSEQALAQLKIPSPKPAVPNLPAASVTAAPKPAAAQPVPVAVAKPAPADAKLTWEWPAHGKVGYSFGQGSNQKGMSIEGKMGEAILASAPGRVVYSGSGLRGYGKLVIIKHNPSFLSVYAHNSQILVKEGQSVAKGQKIAEMGDTDSNRVGLHFEIRRLGKPTDPLQYLPERAS